MESREEKLKKLREAQEKLKQRSALPTVKKDELVAQSNTTSMNALNNNQSINSKIDNLSNSLDVLKTAKEILIKNAKKKVEIIFIIDKSGSVEGTEEQVSRGIDKILNTQRSKGRNPLITTVLFDKDIDTVCDRLPIDKVKSIHFEANYQTALYDTLVYQIEKTKLKQSLDTIKMENTIVVISTDGLDNLSRKSSLDARRLIEERTKAGWEFLFLGTNFDVLEEAERLGIGSKYAAEYDVKRLGNNFEALEKALDDVYEQGHVTEDWSKPITDYKQLSSGESKQYRKTLGDK